MTLVVLGRESTDLLRDWVEELFEGVPAGQAHCPTDGSSNLPAWDITAASEDHPSQGNPASCFLVCNTFGAR